MRQYNYNDNEYQNCPNALNILPRKAKKNLGDTMIGAMRMIKLQSSSHIKLVSLSLREFQLSLTGLDALFQPQQLY